MILALCAGVSIIFLAVGAAYGRTAQTDAQLLSTTLGAVIGALAGYLGYRHGNGKDEEKKD